MQIKRILITTDFSDESVKAFPVARHFAEVHNASITLLSVIEDWDLPQMLLREIPNPEGISNYRKEIRGKAEQACTLLAAQHFPGVNLDTQVILADKAVAEEICDIADERQIDLIVIATNSRNAVEALLLGSVTQKVIKTAPCPVLVLPRDAEVTLTDTKSADSET